MQAWFIQGRLHSALSQYNTPYYIKELTKKDRHHNNEDDDIPTILGVHKCMPASRSFTSNTDGYGYSGRGNFKLS